MKLIGVPILLGVIRNADPSLRGAVLALHAELAAADWSCVEEALTSYPNAEREGHRLVVDLDHRHCAVVGINYEVGIAMIEFAGCRVNRAATLKVSAGRRA